MSHLRVVPIVEGHGDEVAVRILIERLWLDVLGGEHVEVLQPVRKPKTKLVKGPELRRAIDLAALKLGAANTGIPALILVLVDADADPPCQLCPHLLAEARKGNAHLDIACVVANVEYETWFVAAARSLARFLDMGSHVEIPEDPEKTRSGKGWVKSRRRNLGYSETAASRG